MSLSRLWQLAARRLTQDITLEELEEYEQLLKEHPGVASQLDLHHHFFINRPQDEKDDVTTEAWQRQLEKLQLQFPENFTHSDPQPEVFKKSGIKKYVFLGLFLICVSITGYFFLQSEKKFKAKFTTAVPVKTADTAHEVLLPDGSKIILNKNSHISLSKGFGVENRDVALEGEAFFDVAHNADMPFTVHASSVQIKVLGTTFNVRAYPDEQEVQASLLKGRLEVTEKSQKNIRLLLKPNEKISIPVGDFNIKENSDPSADFLYKMETLQAEESSGMIPETAWMDQKLVFNSESLKNVVEKLEKWYNVSITIEDDALANEKFTGAFENEDITEALTALQFTFPFHFKQTRRGVFIIKR